MVSVESLVAAFAYFWFMNRCWTFFSMFLLPSSRRRPRHTIMYVCFFFLPVSKKKKTEHHAPFGGSLHRHSINSPIPASPTTCTHAQWHFSHDAHLAPHDVPRAEKVMEQRGVGWEGAQLLQLLAKRSLYPHHAEAPAAGVVPSL